MLHVNLQLYITLNIFIFYFLRSTIFSISKTSESQVSLIFTKFVLLETLLVHLLLNIKIELLTKSFPQSILCQHAICLCAKLNIVKNLFWGISRRYRVEIHVMLRKKSCKVADLTIIIYTLPTFSWRS